MRALVLALLLLPLADALVGCCYGIFDKDQTWSVNGNIDICGRPGAYRVCSTDEACYAITGTCAAGNRVWYVNCASSAQKLIDYQNIHSPDFVPWTKASNSSYILPLWWLSLSLISILLMHTLVVD